LVSVKNIKGHRDKNHNQIMHLTLLCTLKAFIDNNILWQIITLLGNAQVRSMQVNALEIINSIVQFRTIRYYLPHRERFSTLIFILHNYIEVTAKYYLHLRAARSSIMS
jgi:hypothetical protein